VLADELELFGLHADDQPRQPADDLGNPLLAGNALGEEQSALERTVGNGAGGQAP
jgi:hypothetical protein